MNYIRMIVAVFAVFIVAMFVAGDVHIMQWTSGDRVYLVLGSIFAVTVVGVRK